MKKLFPLVALHLPFSFVLVGLCLFLFPLLTFSEDLLNPYFKRCESSNPKWLAAIEWKSKADFECEPYALGVPYSELSDERKQQILNSTLEECRATVFGNYQKLIFPSSEGVSLTEWIRNFVAMILSELKRDAKLAKASAEGVAGASRYSAELVDTAGNLLKCLGTSYIKYVPYDRSPQTKKLYEETIAAAQRAFSLSAHLEEMGNLWTLFFGEFEAGQARSPLYEFVSERSTAQWIGMNQARKRIRSAAESCSGDITQLGIDEDKFFYYAKTLVTKAREHESYAEERYHCLTKDMRERFERIRKESFVPGGGPALDHAKQDIVEVRQYRNNAVHHQCELLKEVQAGYEEIEQAKRAAERKQAIEGEFYKLKQAYIRAQEESCGEDGQKEWNELTEYATNPCLQDVSTKDLLDFREAVRARIALSHREKAKYEALVSALKTAIHQCRTEVEFQDPADPSQRLSVSRALTLLEEYSEEPGYRCVKSVELTLDKWREEYARSNSFALSQLLPLKKAILEFVRSKHDDLLNRCGLYEYKSGIDEILERVAALDGPKECVEHYLKPELDQLRRGSVLFTQQIRKLEESANVSLQEWMGKANLLVDQLNTYIAGYRSTGKFGAGFCSFLEDSLRISIPQLREYSVHYGIEGVPNGACDTVMSGVSENLSNGRSTLANVESVLIGFRDYFEGEATRLVEEGIQKSGESCDISDLKLGIPYIENFCLSRGLALKAELNRKVQELEREVQTLEQTIGTNYQAAQSFWKLCDFSGLQSEVSYSDLSGARCFSAISEPARLQYDQTKQMVEFSKATHDSQSSIRNALSSVPRTLGAVCSEEGERFFAASEAAEYLKQDFLSKCPDIKADLESYERVHEALSGDQKKNNTLVADYNAALQGFRTIESFTGKYVTQESAEVLQNSFAKEHERLRSVKAMVESNLPCFGNLAPRVNQLAGFQFPTIYLSQPTSGNPFSSGQPAFSLDDFNQQLQQNLAQIGQYWKPKGPGAIPTRPPSIAPKKPAVSCYDSCVSTTEAGWGSAPLDHVGIHQACSKACR
ncbi:MAG: hypothetical protein KDD64_14665 [Bdellovibrionales bacterium]|nr:hypothetical protein [Bdellovibrionales bacterium]